MKNAVKLFLVIAFAAVALCLTAGLTSCEEEEGGTIVVINNRSGSGWITVIITDARYFAVTGQRDIPANQSMEFAVSENGTYWVWTSADSYYKSVSVRGGATVTVTVEY